MWADWYRGTMAGIQAPVNSTTEDVMWAWSSKESGAVVMRWNNPLNTTEELLAGADIDPDMNRVGVESYPTIQDGVIATVATLLNGRYPTIVSHFRYSVPRTQWGDACAELGIWGTGCNWLGAFYGAAPGSIGGDMTDSDLVLIHDELQFALWGIIDTSAQSRNDFLFAVKNGRSIASIADGWKQNPQAAKWMTQLAALNQPTTTAGQQAILDAIRADSTMDTAILSALNSLTDLTTDVRQRVQLIEQAPAIGAEHTVPPGP